MNKRGPDFAEELSTSERETLDRLRSRSGTRRRGGAGIPLSAGISAAAVLVLVVSAVTVLRATSTPVPVGSPVPAVSVLDQLAAAAESFATAAPDAKLLPAVAGDDDVHTELRLEVIVSHTGRDCLAESAAETITIKGASQWPRPATGRIRFDRVSPPKSAAVLAGCEPQHPWPAEPPAFLGDTADYGADLPLGWKTLVLAEPGIRALPPYADPRALDSQVTVASIEPTVDAVTDILDLLSTADVAAAAARGIQANPDMGTVSARWWKAWVDLMTSPLVTRAQRLAALRAAAKRSDSPRAAGEMTGVSPVDADDVTGRAGVAVQVPYLRFTDETVAKLTFDPLTGALLQRAVYYSVGSTLRCEITVFTVTDTGHDTDWIHQLAAG